MRSSCFVSREHSTRCLVDWWEFHCTTIHCFEILCLVIALHHFRDSEMNHALHGMAGAMGLSYFLLVFFENFWIFSVIWVKFCFFFCENSQNSCSASSILIPLSQGVPNLSPEKCVRVFALMWPLDYLWNPLTRLEDLPTDRPHPSCHPSGIPDPISWWLIRHFAQKTEPEDELDAAQFPETKSASNPNNSCGGEIEDEMLPELTDYPGTTRNTKLFVLQKIFSVTCWVLVRESRTAPIFLGASVFGSILKPKNQEQITHPYVVQHPEKWLQIL